MKLNTQSSNFSFNVFFQFGRRYEIQLQLNRRLGDNVTVAKLNPNISLKKLAEGKWTTDLFLYFNWNLYFSDRNGQILVAELTPPKDKLLNEHLELNTDRGPFVVMMSARVLGNKQIEKSSLMRLYVRVSCVQATAKAPRCSSLESDVLQSTKRILKCLTAPPIWNGDGHPFRMLLDTRKFRKKIERGSLHRSRRTPSSAQRQIFYPKSLD